VGEVTVPQEFLAYSVPLADARPRLTEAWENIRLFGEKVLPALRP